MQYLYETHLHTKEASACGNSKGREYIKRYKDLGYAGIMVTDHFYRGNTAINRNLPWNEWVNCFCLGYENARDEGLRRGLDVFFGWEETYNGDDYLVYGLDKEWLLEHPEVREWTRKQQYEEVRRCGGCVVQAHPFRQRAYIPRVVLSAGCVDAVEAVNGGHEDFSYDALAYRYAKKIGKPVTAGSDIHDAYSIYYGDIFGVYSENKLNNISDFVNMILDNKIAGIKTNESRLDFYGTENVKIPVEVRDENDRVTGKNWKDLVF